LTRGGPQVPDSWLACPYFWHHVQPPFCLLLYLALFFLQAGLLLLEPLFTWTQLRNRNVDVSCALTEDSEYLRPHHDDDGGVGVALRPQEVRAHLHTTPRPQSAHVRRALSLLS
jgi:hypothetical protein